MNIHVDDKLKAEYDDALAKLKADKYEDKIPPAEKLKLEEKVMRWLLIERLEQQIAELNEGASPYDYAGVEHINIDKVLKA
jgi:hypothetical protein